MWLIHICLAPKGGKDRGKLSLLMKRWRISPDRYNLHYYLLPSFDPVEKEHLSWGSNPNPSNPRLITSMAARFAGEKKDKRWDQSRGHFEWYLILKNVMLPSSCKFWLGLTMMLCTSLLTWAILIRLLAEAKAEAASPCATSWWFMYLKRAERSMCSRLDLQSACEPDARFAHWEDATLKPLSPSFLSQVPAC